MDRFILTNRKTYTPEEVIDIFSQYARPENMRILVDHLIYPELAESILSFIEIDGEMHFNLGNGGDLIKIKINKKDE